MISHSQYKYHAYTHNFLQSIFITDAWWLYFAGETCCMLGIKKNEKVCCTWQLIYYLLSKWHNGMSKISLQASFMVWCLVTSKPKRVVTYHIVKARSAVHIATKLLKLWPAKSHMYIVFYCRWFHDSVF